MTETGAELLADILDSYGFKRVFGNPGTTELPMIDAFSESDIDFTLGMHEDIAVGMASGYAMKKQDMNNSNPVSFVNLHTTPGLLHGSGNIYNAKRNNAPVIITTGSQSNTHEDRNPSLSGSRKSSIQDQVKWAREVSSADELPSVFRKAYRRSVSPPSGPVYLDIPMNVQNQLTDQEPVQVGEIQTSEHPSNVDSFQRLVSDDDEVVIFVGDAVRIEGNSSVEEVVRLSEYLDADVYGEILMSRTCFDFSHPNWKGGLKHKSSPQTVCDEADVVIEIGCISNTPLVEMDFAPYKCDSCVITQSLDSASKNGHADLTYVGSIEHICQQINDVMTLRHPQDSESNTTDIDGSLSVPVSYESFNNSLTTCLDDSSNLFEEGVTVGSDLRPSINSNFNLYSTKGGGLGYGMPGSVGVQLAEQDYRQESNYTISLIGDGSLQYYPQTLYSANQYIESSLTFLVPNNNGYEILKDDERKDETYLNFDGNLNVTGIADNYGVASEVFESGSLVDDIDRHVSQEEPTFLEVPVIKE